jgi:hypothetical protein
MRIDNTLNAFYNRFTVPAEQARALAVEAKNYPVQPGARQAEGTFIPGIIVDISPEGMAAYKKSKETEDVKSVEELAAMTECQTCKNRKYQDGSNDPSVSFQTPTRISPGQSAAMVMAHEQEHVSHEQAKAEQEDRKIISQTVTLESSICPECGRVYISGGVTRTVTAEDKSKGASED